MPADHSAGTEHSYVAAFSTVSLQGLAVQQLNMVPKQSNLPSLWDGAEFGIDERYGLVAGVPEVDEPFLVQEPCGLFQEFDPPPVALNEAAERAEAGESKLRIVCVASVRRLAGSEAFSRLDCGAVQ